jgi:hypothetical protein
VKDDRLAYHRKIVMQKVLNQGSVTWLVTKDDNGMINWVLKGRLPDAPEFVLGRGFVGKLSDANMGIVSEATAFILKRRIR